MHGGGLLGRCEVSTQLHREAGHGRAGGRRGLAGGTGRARERRGALGRWTVRTLVPRRDEGGAPSIRSHGALGHGHAGVVGRPRAVPCTVNADFRTAAQHASGDQNQHQSAEHKPQARR
jgi:hypothetical protein